MDSRNACCIVNTFFSKQFDHHYIFPEGKPVTVDGDTTAILKSSRFKDDFMFNKASSCATVLKVIYRMFKKGLRAFFNVRFAARNLLRKRW